MDPDLSLHLVVVELRELAPMIHLDGDLCASGLADCQVHCGRVTTTQFLGKHKLVDAPGLSRGEHNAEK